MSRTIGVAYALGFATAAHGDQKRKYTGEPYIVHPEAVAHLVTTHHLGVEATIVALLHDVLEDTPVTRETLVASFGQQVADYVQMLTDTETGNRAERKEAARKRLAAAPALVQSVKVADLIDNTPSIVEHDPEFAVLYLREMEALLDSLKEALPSLRALAYNALARAHESLDLVDLG